MASPIMAVVTFLKISELDFDRQRADCGHWAGFGSISHIRLPKLVQFVHGPNRAAGPP